MKLTNLLQFAGKINNLQQAYKVFGCVPTVPGLHLQNVFSNIPIKHLYCQKRVIFQVQSKKNNLRHQKARKK